MEVSPVWISAVVKSSIISDRPRKRRHPTRGGLLSGLTSPEKSVFDQPTHYVHGMGKEEPLRARTAAPAQHLGWNVDGIAEPGVSHDRVAEFALLDIGLRARRSNSRDQRFAIGDGGGERCLD